MEAPVRLVWFFTFICVFTGVDRVSGDIIVSGQYGCGSYQFPKEVRITDRDEETIFSQTDQYYRSNINCILTIIGKRNYQLELEITQIDIDKHAYQTEHCGGFCCTDFVKIFNGYTVDNARLLPGMSQWGLCGEELPKKTTYATTQNFVTIQFKADERTDYKRGFTVRLRQYPWRNPGNVYPDGGNRGGWNDGTRKELQVDWNDQNQVPGDYVPGGGNDYDTEKGGIKCYECQGCSLDSFDPKRELSAVKGGCHVCSKTWRDEFESAQRQCFTKLQYKHLLLTLIDTSVGDGKVKDFRGCRAFTDNYGIFTNYCFCDGNYCNSVGSVKINVLAFLTIISALVFTA